jgi:hypothetical protein
MATGSEVFLTQQQHSELRSIAQSRTLPAGYVFRAKLILMLAEACPLARSSNNSRPLRRPSFARSSASGNLDLKDWAPIILAKSPVF